MARLRTLASAIAGGALALTLAAAVSPDAGPACFEDEVIVWTGDDHTACVALDDLTEGEH